MVSYHKQTAIRPITLHVDFGCYSGKPYIYQSVTDCMTYYVSQVKQTPFTGCPPMAISGDGEQFEAERLVRNEFR